jgi:Na+-driven multidrug efflux pump
VAALRGAGNSRAPMIITLCSFVGFRQLYLFLMSNICNEILPIAMGYPAGWLLCSTITAIYYHKVQLGKTRLV